MFLPPPLRSVSTWDLPVWQKCPALFRCASATPSGLRLTLFICCIYVSFFFRLNLSSCDSWPRRVRRAVHLNILAKFGASMVSAIAEIMAYCDAPKVTCSSRHLVDCMTWSPVQSPSANTPDHSPQLEVLMHIVSTGTNSILDCMLARRITYCFHPGHCHAPVRPVETRAIDDFLYSGWSRQFHAAEGAATTTYWAGVFRSGAANIFKDENNLEHWGLLTCGNCRPCRARLHNTYIYLTVAAFLYFHTTTTTFVFLSSRVYVFIAMITPITWATRSPLPWLFPSKRCIARRLVHPLFADYFFILFVFLSPFKSRRPCTIQRYFACFSYSLISCSSILWSFPVYPIYNWLYIIVCFLFDFATP